MNFPLPGSEGWKEAAGRDNGTDGYAFGDITRAVGRGLFRKLSGINWKDASGREAGTSSYEFGDISRSALRAVSSSFSGCTASCVDEHKALEFTGDVGDVWRMFFVQTRVCVLKAIEEGIISVADVEEQDPYLFLGLPGLTLLELSIRSLHAPNDTLVLASGDVLSRQNLPEGQGSAELFNALMYAIQELRGAALSEDELSRLRHAVLRVEGDQSSQPGSREASFKINRCASMFQTMATDMSQMPFFRAHFLDVLQLMPPASHSRA